MEEIDVTTNKNDNKNINIKKWIIILALVGISILIFSLGLTLLKESGPEIEIVNSTLSVEYNEYLGYSAVITGVAKNPTKRKYSYASIQFSLYDANGNNLGTALASINNLGGGETWNFEATLLSFPGAKPVNYKVSEIVTW